MHKRILLKISGEELSGEHDNGVDPEVIKWIAGEAKKVVDKGCGLVIVAGAGNLVRGVEVAGNGIKRVTADQMGMLSGLINAMAMTDIFESCGVPTRCLSNIFVQQVAENYVYRLAEKHLDNNRVLIIAGGIGRPYATHDSAAVSLGLELDCDLVLKATKVDGVYDKDPMKFPGAKRYEQVSYQEALENPDIKVMDKSAMGLAAEYKKHIIVYNLHEKDALARIVNGEPVGTLIS